MRKPIFLFVVFCLAFSIYFSWVSNVLADFGVSPSTISNPRLLPGSHFEQTIKLSRSESKQDLKLEITIEPSEIENWIKIYPVRDEFSNGVDQVDSFTIPKDKKEIYFKVSVDVPQNAEIGDYPGTILIRGKNLTTNIGLDLAVTERYILDLKVYSPSIPDLKQGENIKALLKIENRGNVEGSPSRVHLDVYNLLGEDVLESMDVVELSSIKPFQDKEIGVEFPIKLKSGQYRAELTVFWGRAILKRKELIFGILSPEKTEKTEKKEISFPVSIQNITEFIHSYIEYFYIGLATVLIGGLILLKKKKVPKKTDTDKKRRKAKKTAGKKRTGERTEKIRDIKPVSKIKVIEVRRKR